MQESNEIPKPDTVKPAPLVAVDDSEFACYLDTAKFNQLHRAATLLASTEIVPARYQKKPADCFVAMQMAIRMHSDPLMFMQNTYVIQGKPGMEAKYVIALINSRGPFKGPVQWKFKGEGHNRSCTAYATHKITGEVCESTVTWDMAEKEGWTKKNGSKWMTMPDLMFQYRSASFLANLYCPEVKMGMMTVEEIIDITPSFSDANIAAQGTITTQAGSEAVDANFEQAEPQDGQQDEPPAPDEPKTDTPPQLRYLCACKHETDKLTEKGLCPKCLGSKITDQKGYMCPTCETEMPEQKGGKCPSCKGKLVKQGRLAGTQDGKPDWAK